MTSNSSSNKKTEQIRINELLARRIRVIAAAHGRSLPDWLEEKLGPIVAEELPAAMKAIGLPDEEEEESPKKKKGEAKQ